MLIDHQSTKIPTTMKSRRRGTTLLGILCSGFFLSPITAAERNSTSDLVIDERNQPELEHFRSESRKRKLRNSDAVPSLDGSDNNSIEPQRGTSNTPYTRLSPTIYSDGISGVVEGPDLRYISNRIFQTALKISFHKTV